MDNWVIAAFAEGVFTRYLGVLEKQIETLYRCQSLEEVQRLYDSSKYAQVVDLLLQTFSGGSARYKAFRQGSQERHTQLKLLQDSLLHLQDFQVLLVIYPLIVMWSG